MVCKQPTMSPCRATSSVRVTAGERTVKSEGLSSEYFGERTEGRTVEGAGVGTFVSWMKIIESWSKPGTNYFRDLRQVSQTIAGMVDLLERAAPYPVPADETALRGPTRREPAKAILGETRALH